MPCSPERLAANRKNALRSTGPRTPEGKEISRRNGLKHGLTGEGIALPVEDAAEVERRLESFERDLKPKDDVARFLARRAAILSVRLDRCVRHEAAVLTRDILLADEVEEARRRMDVDDLVALLADDPASAVRQLRRSPEGIDRMMEIWADLRADLAGPGRILWFDPQRDRAAQLLGHEYSHRRPTRADELYRSLVVESSPDREAARAEMIAVIDAEVARLQADRDGLDHDAIARDRAGAPARAMFDVSREGDKLRKYEAAAERGFFQALKAIERINAGADGSEATAKPETPSDELGSSWTGAESSADPIPKPSPRPVPAARPMPIASTRAVAGPPSGPSEGSPPHCRRIGG